MPSAKIKLYKGKTLSNGEHPIIIELFTHKIFRIALKKSSQLKHWDSNFQEPNKKHPNYKNLLFYIRRSKMKLDQIIMDLELDDISITRDEVSRRFFNKTQGVLLREYGAQLSNELRDSGSIKTAEWYEYAIQQAESFSGGLYLNDINYEFLESFKRRLSKERNSGGVSYVLRGLRAIINKAIKSRKVRYSEHPFLSIKIPQSKKVDKSLTKEEVMRLMTVSLSPALDHARSIWLSLFFLRGMEFVDLAYLEWSDVGRTKIEYDRSKNSRHYNIGLNGFISSLFEKHRTNSKRVFSLLSEENNYKTQEGYNEFKAVKDNINKRLRQIGRMLDFEESLNTKIAKHTFAHIMDGMVDDRLLQGLLGHEDRESTARYTGKAKNQEMDESVEALLAELSIKT